MTITALARQNIQALTPYQSARRLGGQGDIWLNANEFPLSPAFIPSDYPLNRYPEPQPQAVLDAYATYAGVSAENVLVSRGGDESIELIVRAFCEDDEYVLYCPPTYGMYAVSSQTCNIATKTVPLTADFELNLDEIAQQLDKVKVVFVCRPNNPTGTLINRDDLERLLAITKGRAIVVVDEAYIEFCKQESMASELDRHPHLAIIRTLSKAFALAGIRCGFTLANPELIGILQKVIAPYPIPMPVAHIAEKALSKEGISHMRANVAQTLAERTALQSALSALPCVDRVFASDGNYLLVRFHDGQKVFNTLWEQGIILRNQHHALMLENCIRISIGTQAENARVLNALQSL